MPKTPAKNLTALAAKKMKQPGKYACGHGLYLKVAEGANGGVSKRWYWRGSVQGKRKEISIGPYAERSLSEAKEIATDWRRKARSGNDPMLERDKDKKTVLTFKEAARTCHEEAIAPGLSNEKHTKQWIGTLEKYAFPKIGRKPINLITQEDIIKILKPIWVLKHETATRTKQRIKRVFEWARPRSDCGMDNQMNPAAIPKDVLPIVPKSEQKHHAALPFGELPKLMGQLKDTDTISAYALRFHILTASRPIETRGARWSEIDIKKKLWTIPAERMKARHEHQVPLSKAALAILKEVKGLSTELVFSSKTDPSKMMSDSTMNTLLVRIGVPRSKTTVHGFRSTFRNWAEEKTEFSHEVKERALAHTIKNKAEAAYNRSPLLDKRKGLMAKWAEFATSNYD
ncbi:MAG: integrase [Nitrospirales bacterium]|nr:MAG: integrase [Nitrospirales bacterium]